jgi:hypothetical protein
VKGLKPKTASAQQCFSFMTPFSDSVGTHYGGISASAVSNIRRKVRGGRDDVLPVVGLVLSTIREAISASG